MSRKHHYRTKSKEPPEMDITTFLNLMVVLVPFLLITAVFSRITIMELDIPSGAAGPVDKPKITVEVIIREDRLELGNGRGVIARMPNVNGEYDLTKLSGYLQKIKGNYPDKTDATILIEPDIEYDYMVKIMDAVRSAEITQGGTDQMQKVALFPDMSLGEAP
ncbi:MAG: biopolymer transporter ExbD [Gammaproteobacteria bacterium]